MRKVLSEFYPPEDFKALWKEATFVFDANVLLDIFRYRPDTSKQLRDLLGTLGTRAWLPYQAALEYQTLWRGAGDSAEKEIAQAAEAIDGAFSSISERVKKYTDADLQIVVENQRKALAEQLAKAKSAHAAVPREALHEAITELFDGKVGPPDSAEVRAQRITEAEKRFKDKVPPGFLDAKKEEKNAYGDVFLWFQMLDHAKSSKKPIIFVTGDSKPDWWQKEGSKSLGPRPELVREMKAVGEVGFYMYSTERFLENARKFLGLDVTDDAIREAGEVQRESTNYRYTVPDEDALRHTTWSLVDPSEWQNASGSMKYWIPPEKLYGKNFGSSYLEGLSSDADWPHLYPRRQRHWQYQGGWKPLQWPVQNAPRSSITENAMFSDSDGETVLVSEVVLRHGDNSRRLLRFDKDSGTSKYLVQFPESWANLPHDALRELYTSAVDLSSI